jgi:hypothetical protein
MQIAKKTSVEEKVRLVDDCVSEVLGRKSDVALSIEKGSRLVARNLATGGTIPTSGSGSNNHTTIPKHAFVTLELGELIRSKRRDPAMKVSLCVLRSF